MSRLTEIPLDKKEVAEIAAWARKRFPPVLQKRHAFCKECGTEYGLTKRTFCPRCQTDTVDAWPISSKEIAI